MGVAGGMSSLDYLLCYGFVIHRGFRFFFMNFVLHLFFIVVAMTVRGTAASQQRPRVRPVKTALEFNGNLFVD